MVKDAFKHRRIAAVCPLLVLLVLLAGCAGGNSGNSNDDRNGAYYGGVTGGWTHP